MQGVDTGYIRYANHAMCMGERVDYHRLNSNPICMFGQIKKCKNLSTFYKGEFFLEPI
jgi:hypothetical protein